MPLKSSRHRSTTQILMFALVTAIVAAILAVLIVVGLQHLVFRAISPPAQWWAAVAILATLASILFAIAILVMNAYSDHKRSLVDVLSRQQEFVDAQQELQLLLLNLPDVLEGGAPSLIPKLSQAVDALYASSDREAISSAIRKWSTRSWREGSEDVCLHLRQLAYSKDPTNPWNRAYLANIQAEVDSGEEHTIHDLIDAIDKAKTGPTSMGKAALGKYYMRVGRFDDAVKFLQAPAERGWNLWVMRAFCLSLLCLKDHDTLRNTVDSWKTHAPLSSWSNPEITKQVLFITLLRASYNHAALTDFWPQINPGLLLSAPSTKNTNYRISFFGTFNAIRNRQDPELLQAYLLYYFLYGAKDPDADHELRRATTWHSILKRLSEAYAGADA